MRVALKTAPTIEPITLTELLLHLRQDSEDIATALTTAQSILPGSHAVADNYTTHAGTGVSVIGKQALVNLNAGTVGDGGTIEAKIQESDDNATWTDWTGGGFTLVNAANDNAIQEKAYTGTKAYIRVVAKVLVAACEFGADILTISHETIEDDWLTDTIQAAREHVEHITRRQLLTATWEYYLDRFPGGSSAIVLPFGNLGPRASFTRITTERRPRSSGTWITSLRTMGLGAAASFWRMGKAGRHSPPTRRIPLPSSSCAVGRRQATCRGRSSRRA